MNPSTSSSSQIQVATPMLDDVDSQGSVANQRKNLQDQLGIRIERLKHRDENATLTWKTVWCLLVTFSLIYIILDLMEVDGVVPSRSRAGTTAADVLVSCFTLLFTVGASLMVSTKSGEQAKLPDLEQRLRDLQSQQDVSQDTTLTSVSAPLLTSQTQAHPLSLSTKLKTAVLHNVFVYKAMSIMGYVSLTVYPLWRLILLGTESSSSVNFIKHRSGCENIEFYNGMLFASCDIEELLEGENLHHWRCGTDRNFLEENEIPGLQETLEEACKIYTLENTYIQPLIATLSIGAVLVTLLYIKNACTKKPNIEVLEDDDVSLTLL